MKVVIIGGGAAGASCAARLRRINAKAEITILERTNEISIGTCGIPYYVAGVVESDEDLRISSVEDFAEVNVKVKINTDVLCINRKEKSVNTSKGEIIPYDRLDIATGAKPFSPKIEGIKNANVFTVRHLYDAEAIRAYIKKHKVKKAIVAGGGFIGIEMAEGLTQKAIKTTIVEQAKQVLVTMDAEMAKLVQNKLEDEGVELELGDGIAKIEKDKVILKSGKKIAADIVIVATGVVPDNQLAVDAGLKVGIKNAIEVNKYLQTSDKNIYACGDGIVVNDFVSKSPVIVALAGPANRQGRIVADNIAGKKQTYKDTQGTAILKVFDVSAARTGNTEEQLIRRKIRYKKVHVWANSHAGYYPDAEEMLIKLLFGQDGKILGVQIVGGEGVDKRIDVMASIMRLNGTIQDLIDAELAYSPPYSSAKDAVNIVGMAASNVKEAFVKPYFGTDFADAQLVDVRSKEMFKDYHIKGSINIPLVELAKKAKKLDKNKKVILVCNRGKTGYNVSRILMQQGFKDVYNLSGGLMLYQAILA
jgi:NADPH-dependent 2,4-dienoyl-CoA reductase/sulfur reductase-like enzyme/rhodanese-related sulfurtransferase